MSSEIARSVLIDAPATVIFKALTDEKELVRWLPRTAKMDARVGGAYEFNFYWAAKNLETTAKGRVVELVPNKKLAYTYASSEDGAGIPPSLVTWTLEEESEGRTRVTLTHSGIDAASCLRRSLGWGYYLERLGACYAQTGPQEITEQGKAYSSQMSE